ncbi:hypothetical protein [Roseateles terrae]|uniref:Uncharacterized protein n=1 Tax=Roseateles terrae TaxID=431060 RepID=A0ABR6GXK5_9BURK|nr:hypothetical protein [Roseateles terrae]MBB3196779.1 hypothetical protein [Roseateles terrae]
MSSSVTSSVTASLPPGTLTGSSAQTLWMSADVVWTIFFVLLALSLLASLRFDWLRVWWIDQWRHLTGADDAKDRLSATVSLPQPRSPGAPATHPPAHGHAQSHGHAPAPSLRMHRHRPSALPGQPGPTGLAEGFHRPLRPAAPPSLGQRPLFHRTGRRH